MATISYGDLASTISNTRLTSEIKQNLDKYTYEVATGNTDDISDAVSGDFSLLASLERSLRSISAYETAQNEASLFTSSVQTILGNVSDQVSNVAFDLIAAASAGDETNLSVTSGDARVKFDAVVASLNTTVGSRALFSGTATDTSPLASASVMLADIQALVAGEATAAGVIAVVDDWFDSAGGGFETIGYLGSQNELSPFTLSENESANVSIKADDDEIREVLKGLALASLVDGGLFEDSIVQQSFILQTAGENLLSSEAGLLSLQADVGVVEQQISDAQVARSAEEFAMEIAKSDLIGVDTFEAASNLSQTELQLEMMYTITARLSQLKLSDYI